jgi:hypothetical protein
MHASELSPPARSPSLPIPTRRAVAYVRVSTSIKARRGDPTTFEQKPDVQEQPLRDLARQRGWTLQKVYSDRASGSKEQRADLNALMQDARRGLFDVVVVWRFDRFARSVNQLVLALEEFRARNRFPLPSGSIGHLDTHGQGDVHRHRRDGRAGTKYHPRTRRRRLGTRAEERGALRPAGWTTESHFRSGANDPPSRASEEGLP